MNFIKRTSEIQVCGSYDVIVVGGGIAGVAAALSAARNGAKTLLLEKSVMLGGLATIGHIVIYLPICDGLGRKVAGGIAEELLHASIKYGYNNLSEEWLQNNDRIESHKRYQTVFNAPAFIIALDELISEAKIDVLFDTVFSEPVIEDGFIKAVIVENKNGRQAYECKAAVDASGDADVMYRAGAACTKGINHLSYWGYNSTLDSMEAAVSEKDIMKGINIMTLGADCNGVCSDKRVPDTKYDGTDVKQITQFVLEGRKIALNMLASSDKKKHSILALPSMPQFRTTRRIKGIYELQPNEYGKSFDDSIGCVGDWRKSGPVYEIPYRTLIAQECKNIVAAGRIIASEGDAWEVTRVIPAAALTGQAAGAAAAMAAADACAVTDIDVRKLQDNLRKTGVIIHV